MKARSTLLALALCASIFSLGHATAAVVAGCAGSASGGDWSSYGGSAWNTRNQSLETTINANNAANLTSKATFDAVGDSMSNTPIIADGCAFLATSGGAVYALNADTLQLVWKMTPAGKGSGQLLLGGVIVGSPLVRDGVVYVGVSNPGAPYVAAIDEASGTELWEAVVEEGQPNALINASPVYQNGMIFMGFAGNEGSAPARGGFAIVQAGHDCAAGTAHLTCFHPVAGATSGTRLVHTYTISDAEYAQGYRGASVWCTAAVDGGYAYACGGNPASKQLEARYSNSLLKIDMIPGSPTFGQVVGAYKGTTDQYFPGLDRQPACDALGTQVVYVAWSATCLQLDLDFGASPSLWRDSLGRLIVGDLQKAGVYHAVFADNMQQDWTALVGTPCFSCNAASGAVDGSHVYVEGTLPGQLVALTHDSATCATSPCANGRYSWAMPIADGVHFQSVTVTNGVVYVVDTAGFLDIFDASTGVPIQKHAISVDVQNNASNQSSQGVAVARNTVYVISGEFLVSYHL